MSTTPKRPGERINLKQTTGQFSSRKKSCVKCSEAKTRCSLQRPVCSRCQGRGLTCAYFTLDSPSVSGGAPPPVNVFTSLGDSDSLSSPVAVEELRDSATPIEPPLLTLESVRIGSRWLDALIPPPGRIAKNFSFQTVQYMSRILKSYPKIILKDDALPPVVHPCQSVVPQEPLANCRTLLRMWENKAPRSELLVRETIWREMNRLFEEHRSYDHITLLSACQAYMLYSIHLFFCTDPETCAMIDTTTMINLQELASAISLTGLYPSGVPHPDWESWIVAEAKRRTLYTMYTFDHIFNYSHNTTSYVGTELGHLPLPSNKALWAATTKNTWEREYERFSAEWPSETPRIEDLWPHPAVAVVKERRERADRWLESADEFGMFMFALSNMIFGS